MTNRGYGFDGADEGCDYQAVNLITFTTDFGTRDWFVGTMKGVALGINPRATLVDITHEIPPGDVRAGAFALAASYRYFPKGTVHVVVVDPGVGSARHAIAVKTTDYIFVGPDNGVLSFALAREKIKAVRRINNEKLFRHPVSRTFHGRDIFAPVAAHLSRGFAIAKVGPSAPDFIRVPWPQPVVHRGSIEGEVIHVDHFGNAITNIDSESLKRLDKQSATVLVKNRVRCPLANHFEAVPKGKPVALPGSSGLLEIAINQGSAVHKLRLKCGTPVRLMQD